MNKLKELRIYNNLKQKEVADNLNIPLERYRSYENRTCRLNDEILIKFSQLYNVSIDYLLDNDISSKVIYSKEQLDCIKDLCTLNNDYFDLASKYIKNLLADQVELESRKNLLKNNI